MFGVVIGGPPYVLRLGTVLLHPRSDVHESGAALVNREAQPQKFSFPHYHLQRRSVGRNATSEFYRDETP